LKKSVNANILAFTDDKLKNYEQIPVHLMHWKVLNRYRFGHVLVLFFTTGIVW